MRAEFFWRPGISGPAYLRGSARPISFNTLALRLMLVFALLLPAAGCGTKTELLMPNGKPAPRDQRDPSQPPSPLSR